MFCPSTSSEDRPGAPGQFYWDMQYEEDTEFKLAQTWVCRTMLPTKKGKDPQKTRALQAHIPV
jgi:hypothetical protein